MTVDKHLASDEHLLASCGDFHATDQRVIRHVENPNGEEVDSLAYSQIKGLGVVIRPKTRFILLGLGLSLVGIVFPQQFIGLLLVVGGMVSVVFGFLSRAVYVEFRSPALDKARQQKWRVPDVRKEAAQNLLRTVQPLIKQAQKEAESSAQGPQPPESPGGRSPEQTSPTQAPPAS
ncbi:MAG: hypothetical protein HY683_10880 [Chloroflexi bacterium]|nr:hypothetical protein [Chloroflexota bacterium]